MPTTFVNTCKDALGIFIAIGYRTFNERNWKKPQPMFNVLQVKESKVDSFKEFLNKSLVISLKYDTPISLGPFYSSDTKTFIYTTHYSSTNAYMKVCGNLLTSGLSKSRAKATQETNWIYCSQEETKEFSTISNVIMVGVNGEINNFIDFISRKELAPLAKVKKIKDVRGNGFVNYFFFKDEPENLKLFRDYAKSGESVNVIQAKKLT
ncbi:hypothetical protein [Brumimicrobium mesophilum]|uniref:hypothetical protein n=1 Tax=Brumimicrobium mesophilum TaxID=392717 RepID=UPI000D1403DE|nr:hypothetical protein [Brumimicrobium mesophilum]